MGEIEFFWIATAFYGAGFFLYLVSIFTDWRAGSSIATVAAATGLLAHLAGITIRWLDVGHGPFLSFYELTMSNSFAAVAIFLLVAWRHPEVRSSGAIVLPLSSILITVGLLSGQPLRETTPLMNTFWFSVHVVFAKLSYGAYVLSFGLAILGLLKNRLRTRAVISERLPSSAIMEELAFSVIGFGFLTHTIMMFSGAVWSNVAWGVYWSWEPQETWTTFAWIIYGIVLHLRVIHGWRDNRAAWCLVAGMIVILLTTFGVPVWYSDGHTPFMSFG